jgi:hypothetical protein
MHFKALADNNDQIISLLNMNYIPMRGINNLAIYY